MGSTAINFLISPGCVAGFLVTKMSPYKTNGWESILFIFPSICPFYLTILTNTSFFFKIFYTSITPNKYAEWGKKILFFFSRLFSLIDFSVISKIWEIGFKIS